MAFAPILCVISGLYAASHTAEHREFFDMHYTYLPLRRWCSALDSNQLFAFYRKYLVLLDCWTSARLSELSGHFRYMALFLLMSICKPPISEHIPCKHLAQGIRIKLTLPLSYVCSDQLIADIHTTLGYARLSELSNRLSESSFTQQIEEWKINYSSFRAVKHYLLLWFKYDVNVSTSGIGVLWLTKQ